MVLKNEVYQVGGHVFACLDITDKSARELGQMEDSDVAAIHVDPPWGTQATRYFNKLAGKEFNPRESHIILDAVAEYCWTFVAPEVFILMGADYAEEMAQQMSARSFYETNRWDTVYRSDRSKCCFSRFAPSHTTEKWEQGFLDGLRGNARSLKALGRVVKPGDIISDPCIGFGQTLRMAHLLKCRCRGVELVPERLERTVQLAEKLTGETRVKLNV